MARWSSLVPLLVVATSCLATGALALQAPGEGGIQKFLTVIADEDGDAASSAASAKQPVSVLWGLHDASAMLGKLFKYALPKEAFQGDISQYKVRGVDTSDLPGWLTYHEETQTLQGVPGHDELGQEFKIEVTASAQFSNDTISQAKDTFAINVNEESPSLGSMATPLKEAESADETMRPIHCQDGSPVTMVTIIIDADLSNMHPAKKIGMMQGMCDHLKLPVDLLKLLPVGNRPMFDTSALVAGPGNVKKPQNAVAMMQWEVGCGNVNANHMPILQQVEATSHDGSMSQAVGHGIIGWHVTNNRPHAPHRMKRQADVMATPTLLPSLAPPTRQQGPTYIVDETDQPATRVVPVMQSPSFPGEIQPTKTRHHHRTKTRGRHHHHKSKHHKPKHSPTRKPTRTKHTRTPMPTPTVMPIQPTRVVGIMPTVLDTAMQRPRPTYGPASPGVSRTDVLLEPSMTPVFPGRGTEATEILPTRTYIVPDIVTTEPVHPTKTDGVSPTDAPGRPTRRPPKKETPPPGPTDNDFNYAPVLSNDIDKLVVQVGDILNYKIPFDTFYDYEDGNADNLKLVFLAVDGLTVPRTSWVKFDQTRRILFGLPMAENVGRHEYVLAAIDANGKIARDTFLIIVQKRPFAEQVNHEFSLTLDADYNKFRMDVDKRLEIARKLARLYGDNDLSKITVTNIAEGSVVYSWVNNSIPYEPCPTRTISYLRRYLITEDMLLNPALVEVMKPYKVTKAEVVPKEVCQKGEKPEGSEGKSPDYGIIEGIDKDNGKDKDHDYNGGVIIEPATGESLPTHKPVDTGVDSSPRETSDEDVLVAILVPAVVVAAVLLLIGCIVCLLYRRKRKGKLSDEDQHTFVNKGVPIIFADELEEKPSPPTKPLILQDEKPPMPPPGYNRGGSTPSTPRSDHKDPMDFEDDREDLTSPLYQPPPPFTPTNRDPHRNNRPRQASNRRPPPYVPP